MSENIIKLNIWRNYLLSHFFSFGVENGVSYTQDFAFGSNGDILNYQAANESHWELADGKLFIKNLQFETTTEFILPNNFEFSINNKLVGTYLKRPSVHHALIATRESDPFNMDTIQATMNNAVKQIQNHCDGKVNESYSVLPVVHNRTYKKIRLAYILNSVETLPALFPLIKATTQDQRFEVKIVACNKLYYGLSCDTLEPLCKYLDNHLDYNYIKVTGNAYDTMVSLRRWGADFIVRQSEWENDFEPAFNDINLAWSRIIHVPYIVCNNFILSPESEGNTLVSNRFFQYVWRSFTAEKLQEEQIEDLQSTFISSDIFQPIGSMKAQMIKNAQPDWPFENTGRPRVVWISHHSVSDFWFKMGLLPAIYKKVLNWIKSHPEIDVVFNPHPLLEKIIKTDRNVSMSGEEYAKFRSELESLPNAHIFENANQYELTAAADVILTDGISSIYEMQIQNKKIVTLLREDHKELTPRGKQLIKGTHVFPGKQIDDALKKVIELLYSRNDKEEQEKINTAEWLKNDHPEQLIINEMLQEVTL